MKINGIATGKLAVATFGGSETDTICGAKLISALADKDPSCPLVFLDITDGVKVRMVPIHGIVCGLDEAGRLVVALMSPAVTAATTEIVAGGN